MNHKFVFSFLVAMSFSASASDRDPLPPDILDKQTCKEHISFEPSMTMADFPNAARGRELNAYVVVSYRLDGSGKAVDAQVVDSKPKGLFDKTTLSLLNRTQFAAGASQESCTYVRTYSSVRRRGR